MKILLLLFINVCFGRSTKNNEKKGNIRIAGPWHSDSALDRNIDPAEDSYVKKIISSNEGLNFNKDMAEAGEEFEVNGIDDFYDKSAVITYEINGHEIPVHLKPKLTPQSKSMFPEYVKELPNVPGMTRHGFQLGDVPNHPGKLYDSFSSKDLPEYEVTDSPSIDSKSASHGRQNPSKLPWKTAEAFGKINSQDEESMPTGLESNQLSSQEQTSLPIIVHHKKVNAIQNPPSNATKNFKENESNAPVNAAPIENTSSFQGNLLPPNNNYYENKERYENPGTSLMNKLKDMHAKLLSDNSGTQQSTSDPEKTKTKTRILSLLGELTNKLKGMEAVVTNHDEADRNASRVASRKQYHADPTNDEQRFSEAVQRGVEAKLNEMMMHNGQAMWYNKPATIVEEGASKATQKAIEPTNDDKPFIMNTESIDYQKDNEVISDTDGGQSNENIEAKIPMEDSILNSNSYKQSFQQNNEQPENEPYFNSQSVQPTLLKTIPKQIQAEQSQSLKNPMEQSQNLKLLTEQFQHFKSLPDQSQWLKTTSEDVQTVSKQPVDRVVNESSDVPLASARDGEADERDDVGRARSFKPWILPEDIEYPDYNEVKDAAIFEAELYRKRYHADKLAWSDDLSDRAQKQAELLARKSNFDVGKSDAYKLPGETIALVKLNSPNVGKDAMDAWAREAKDFDFKSPLVTKKNSDFVQLMWKSSKHFGMGVAKFKTGAGWIVTSFYDSPFTDRYSELKSNIQSDIPIADPYSDIVG